MKTKQGIQMNEAFGAVLTIVLISILVIVGLVLYTSLGSTMSAPNTAGALVKNESIALLNNTIGNNLAKSTLRDVTCSITEVRNATAPMLAVPATNYTVTNCHMVGTGGADSGFVNQPIKVSYNYNYRATTDAENATEVMSSNFSGYPTLIGLVGTIIFLGIVIGILAASFIFGKKEGA